MARPSQDAIYTFMSITGASESLAVRRLEEHGGNLSEAVNAHFAEGFHQTFAPASSTLPHYNSMQVHSQNHVGQPGLSSLFSAIRSFKPSSLLDPKYRKNFLNQIGASTLGSPRPYASYPSNMTGTAEVLSSSNNGLPHPLSSSFNTGPLTPNVPADLRSPHLHGNDAEEEMVRAAIELSKQEFLSGLGQAQRQPNHEDEELHRAISLSLMEAQREKVKHEQEAKDRDQESKFDASRGSSGKTMDITSKGSSSCRDETKLERLLDWKPDHLQYDSDAHQSDEESEIRLVRKRSSIPQETAADEITLAVHMPDGNRHVCSFLMTDKLQSLFDSIDARGWVKPMTYTLVRPYPREVFTAGDGSSSLCELGLTSKQEALFLEFI